jgi:hypothetical protein
LVGRGAVAWAARWLGDGRAARGGRGVMVGDSAAGLAEAP